jgi:germination protein M
MNRRHIAVGLTVGLVSIALGWALMSQLARMLRSTDDTIVTAPAAAGTTPAPPAVPKIKATLFFGSADGRGLVGVQQDVPFAEGRLAQARALVEAQLAATAPSPLVATVPAGTKLRGLYVSETNEAFVDLDVTVRDKHPGGSLNELFTVYTIVNAVTTNLPDLQNVQLLIDGREVDTLAGHVDLRRPLRKNDTLVTK